MNILLSKLEDKIAACYAEDTVQYTDFLTMEELGSATDFLRNAGLFFVTYGGYEDAQRAQIAIAAQKQDCRFPIVILKGKWDKFGELSHRDVLGGVLSGGLERRCIGDILLDKENDCFYLFAVTRMAEYITKNVERIGRCSIEWSIVSDLDLLPKNTTKNIRVSVSSLRVDTVISAVFHFSRQDAQDKITDKIVYINHRTIAKNTVLVREGDAVVVRGFGKFIFLGVDGVSKKGKTYILVKLYQ